MPAKRSISRTAKPKAAAAKKPAAAAARKHGPRADFGKPVDGFFTRQPPSIRPIVDALRTMIGAAAPDATASLKWGMPVYEIGGTMMCAIGAHKAHVNLILSGDPDTYADPDGLLTGAGKTGRHLKIVSVDDLPTRAIKGWLAKAAARARRG